MKPSSSNELLDILGTVGAISISSLVSRLTGSVVNLFDSLKTLQNEGFVEVIGSTTAVNEFIMSAKILEDENLESEKFQGKLFETLNTQPEAAESTVSLTKKGLMKLS